MENLERGKFEEEWQDALRQAKLKPSDGSWQAIESKLDQSAGFEGAWKNALDGAALNPAESVWQTIDVGLVQAENVMMKSRVLFYQRTAAAVAAILVMSVGFFFYSQPSANKEELAQNSSTVKSSIENSSANNFQTSKSDGSEKITSSNNSLFDSNTKNLISHNSNGENKNTEADTFGLIDRSPEKLIEDKDALYLASITPNKKTTLAKESKSEIQIPEIEKLAKIYKPNNYSIAYRMADIIPEAPKKNYHSNENKWVSVGISSGSLNTAVGGNELVQQSIAKTASYTSLQDSYQTTHYGEKIKRGTSSSFAIGFAKRLFGRFIFQGGVGYTNQNVSSTATRVNVTEANLFRMDNAMPASLETTNSVTYNTEEEIKSQFQFISIPIQAGYMIIDRKLGLQVNAGVAPDFFIKSSVYNQATKEETSMAAGDNKSSFKAMSLAGTGGVELSYRFAKHYRISLAPGLRYSFTPVYKEHALASSKPLVADMGLRLRYVFN